MNRRELLKLAALSAVPGALGAPRTGSGDLVLARQVRGATALGSLHQRSQPRPAADDVVGRDLVGAGAVERPQQVLDVLGCALRVVDGPVVVGVGRADVGEVALGDHEHRASILGHGDDGGDLVAHQVPGHRDVDALGGADRIGVGAFVLGAHVVGPHARRVHDDTGAHAHRASGELVVQRRSSPVDVARLRPGEDRGAVRGGRAGDRDDEPGVVDELPVGADDAAAQSRPAQSREHLDRLRRAGAARGRQDAARRSGDPAQAVAHPEPDAAD